MKTKSRKKAKAMPNPDLPRYVPRDCHRLLTGVYYAELLPGNRVRLVYTNGYKISAIVSKALLESQKFLDIVDAVEVDFATRRLTKMLNHMSEQLQILEMQRGYHYMVKSELHGKYQEALGHYEVLAEKPFQYQLGTTS